MTAPQQDGTATARFLRPHSRKTRYRLVGSSVVMATASVLGIGYIAEHWSYVLGQGDLLHSIMWVVFCLGLALLGFTGIYELGAHGVVVVAYTAPNGETVEKTEDPAKRRHQDPTVTMALPPQVVTETVVERQIEYRSKAPELEETDVYRLFDRTDRLLYVGIGHKAADRWRSHAETKPWWGEVARHHTRRYPFRYQALAVEHAAIMFERPKYNKRRGGLTDHGSDVGWQMPRVVDGALPAPRPRISPESSADGQRPVQTDEAAELPLPTTEPI